MEEQSQPPTVPRRKILTGLAVAGGVSVAVVAGAYGVTELVKSTENPQSEPDIRSVFIGEPVPADDPDSRLWHRAPSQRVALGGQNVIVPLKAEASLSDVKVRSIHDGKTIGFLLEWKDDARDEHTIKTDSFRDACGVLLGPSGASPALWMMGTPDAPVTILHWKADWQKDIDAGFQDLEVAFPNVAFDFYPPLVGVTNPKVPDDYPEETRNWLPGWHVGNPISQPVKTTPVEKLLGIGPGTLEHLPTQDAAGRGVWQNGRWKVVIASPMAVKDAGVTAIEPGQAYSTAFTVWSGADSDRGARKSLTKLGQVTLEPSA